MIGTAGSASPMAATSSVSVARSRGAPVSSRRRSGAGELELQREDRLLREADEQDPRDVPRDHDRDAQPHEGEDQGDRHVVQPPERAVGQRDEPHAARAAQERGGDGERHGAPGGAQQEGEEGHLRRTP
jgi:hypothetical protein